MIVLPREAHVQPLSIDNGETLLDYSNYDINMWRVGVEFIRPKWRLYRSLE